MADTVQACPDCGRPIEVLPAPCNRTVVIDIEPDPKKGTVWVPEGFPRRRGHVQGRDAAKALRACGEPMYRQHLHPAKKTSSKRGRRG